jgi:hypothetical protein
MESETCPLNSPILPDLGDHLYGSRSVLLRVNFRRECGRMTQDNSGHFDAVQIAYFCCRIVA